MRIAFLAYNRDPSIPHIDNDGCPVTVRYYALELGKLGHEIDIFTNKVSPNTRSSNYLKEKFVAQAKDTVSLEKNVKVIRIPAKNFSTNNTFLPKELAEIPEIAESFSNAGFFEDEKLHSYDAVCFFHPLSSFGPLVLGYVLTKNSVLFPMLLSDEYKKYQSVSKIYEEFEDFSLKTVRSVFACSTYEQELILAKGVDATSVEVVHRGFDNSIYTHRQRNLPTDLQKVRIISIGSIKPQKQQLQLIEVAKILKGDGYNPQITIVGENRKFIKNEYESYYKLILKEIKSAGLEQSFIFTGALGPDEIAALLKENDLGVYCSVGESFGKAALESICSGLPTILNTKVDAYRDFAKDGVNALFYDSTAPSCTKMIERILKNENLYRNISEGGRETAISFSWKNVSLQLEAALKEIRK